MIENLELHHLKTLDALYRNRTLSLAAESLNVSQQAVSAKLKRLRGILGDRLFVREGHGIVPTPYALRKLRLSLLFSVLSEKVTSKASL